MKKFSIIAGSIALVFTLIASTGFQDQARALQVTCDPVHVNNCLSEIKDLLQTKPPDCDQIKTAIDNFWVQVKSSSGQGCELSSEALKKLEAIKQAVRKAKCK